jgi:hypothetical protein
MPKRLDVQKHRARGLAAKHDTGPSDLFHDFFYFLSFGRTKGHAQRVPLGPDPGICRRTWRAPGR